MLPPTKVSVHRFHRVCGDISAPVSAHSLHAVHSPNGASQAPGLRKRLRCAVVLPCGLRWFTRWRRETGGFGMWVIHWRGVVGVCVGVLRQTGFWRSGCGGSREGCGDS